MQYTVNFNCEEIDTGGYKYRWQSVTLPLGVFTYPAIVSAIVRERYPEDQMQAIVNNYLTETPTDEEREEFKAMQTWRTFAKKVAKEALKEE